jgi:hypothetical protein
VETLLALLAVRRSRRKVRRQALYRVPKLRNEPKKKAPSDLIEREIVAAAKDNSGGERSSQVIREDGVVLFLKPWHGAKAGQARGPALS